VQESKLHNSHRCVQDDIHTSRAQARAEVGKRYEPKTEVEQHEIRVRLYNRASASETIDGEKLAIARFQKQRCTQALSLPRLEHFNE